MASTTNDSPQFAAALSTAAATQQAVREVCSQSLDRLGGPPDLAIAFVSHHHGPDFAPLAEQLCEQLGTERLLGCTGESIVGGAQEIEERPALSLWLARLPGVDVRLMQLDFERTPEGGSIVGWPDDLPEPWPAGAALLVLGDPFTFPADVLLERLNDDRPGVAVCGGMASGAHGPGQNQLFLGRRALDSGAVAALISGGVRVRNVVSQGCRPIGRHYVVTKAERNVILELGGQPPMAQLHELFSSLSERDRALVQRGLHVGRVINEYQDHFGRGDFLVRNVVGADPDSGAIAIGDYVRPGQTVQFHLRDAESADEDLRELLSQAKAGAASPARGGLLFTCNGRGTRLFDGPHHDAALLTELLGEIPLAGFFAQGELGPIGGRNFVHGFTASVALFEAVAD